MSLLDFQLDLQQTNLLLARIAEALERAYPPLTENAVPPKPAGPENLYRKDYRRTAIQDRLASLDQGKVVEDRFGPRR